MKLAIILLLSLGVPGRLISLDFFAPERKASRQAESRGRPERACRLAICPIPRRGTRPWNRPSNEYTYHYAYRPEVLIYRPGSRYKMKVEGIDETISLVRLK